jgi:hypothetical protein
MMNRNVARAHDALWVEHERVKSSMHQTSSSKGPQLGSGIVTSSSGRLFLILSDTFSALQNRLYKAEANVAVGILFTKS